MANGMGVSEFKTLVRLPLLFPQVAPCGLLFEQAIPAIPMARCRHAAISGIFILAEPPSRAQPQAAIIRLPAP